MNYLRYLILLSLCATLQANSLFNYRPLSIKVIKEDVWITIISEKPWTLSWSGDLKNWVDIDSDIPYDGEVQIKVIIDKGWAGMANFGYYKLSTLDFKPVNK